MNKKSRIILSTIIGLFAALIGCLNAYNMVKRRSTIGGADVLFTNYEIVFIVLSLLTISVLLGMGTYLFLSILDKKKRLTDYSLQVEKMLQVLSVASENYLKFYVIDLNSGDLFRFFKNEANSLTYEKVGYSWDEYLETTREYLDEKGELHTIDELRRSEIGTVFEDRRSTQRDLSTGRDSNTVFRYRGIIRIVGTEETKLAVCTLFDDTESVNRELAIKEVEEKRREKEEAERLRQTALVDALSEDYDVIFVFDYTTGKREVIRKKQLDTGDPFDEIHQEILAKSYTGKDYCETVVAPEYKEDFLITINPENIRNVLREKPALTFNYMVSIGGVQKFENVKVVRSGDDAEIQRIVFGFSNIDAQVREEKRQQSTLQTSLFNEKQMKLSLLSSAKGYHSINVTQNVLLTGVNNVDGNELDVATRVGLQTPCIYSEYIKRIADKLVADNKEGFINCFDRDSLLEHFLSGGRNREARFSIYEHGTNLCYVMASIILNKNSDGDIMATVILYDISEEKQRESELKDALTQADSANKAKTEFLSNVSHDIRTPINAIMGMTKIASLHLDDEEKVKDCLSKIDLSSHHLLELVNEVLDLSKIESGNMDLNEEDFNIHDVVADISAIVIPLAQKRNHDIRIAASSITHENLYGDKSRIKQIINNLIGNAIKYTPNGGHISTEITEEEKGPRHSIFRFIVKDDGIGMQPDFAKRIFESFSRENNDYVRSQAGTGLGMAITLNLVHMLGGEISLETAPDVGSTFTVTLPLTISNVDVSHPKEFKGKRILILCNGEGVSQSCTTSGVCIKTIIEDTGMKCELTYSSEEFISVALREEKNGKAYDGYFIPYEINDNKGPEVMTELADALEQKPHAAIISTRDYDNYAEEAREAGAEYFLVKPVFRASLYQCLSKLIGLETKKEDSLFEENVDYSKFRILMAEDNDFNAEIAEELIGLTKIKMERAEDGSKALSMMQESAPGYYNLILMDIQMPIMDGYEATKAIRGLEREDCKNIPIIALSANAFASDVAKAKEAGMNEHLSKPIEFNKLEDVLKKYLQ